MRLGRVEVEDTFAEAFTMYGSRVLITAVNARWAMHSALAMTGFGSSIIMCGCEAGIEGETNDTPDGRPGVNVLLFSTCVEDAEKQLTRRIAQCVMTAPTAACFNALKGEKAVVVGSSLRYFGDGFQSSKRMNPTPDYPRGRRFWRIPIMGGEFLCDETFSLKKAVGGGNFLIIGEGMNPVLEAAEKAVEAISRVENVITPFPGGVVSSGSKVGSRYSFLSASTNSVYCPTLKSQVPSALRAEETCVLEVVIDGLDVESVKKAMHEGIHAASTVEGVTRISAGNYGGALGKHLIYLREVIT